MHALKRKIAMDLINILFCFKKLGASKEEKKEGTSIFTIFAPHLQIMRGPLNKI